MGRFLDRQAIVTALHTVHYTFPLVHYQLDYRGSAAHSYSLSGEVRTQFMTYKRRYLVRVYKSWHPESVNSSDRHLITVLVFISGQGKTNGKREYSAMTLKKYTFLLLEGRGPLKSIFNLSKG